MKYIILFLLCFNAYANVKVDIVNTKNNKSYSAKFDTIQEAQTWINENSIDKSWGKNEVEVLLSEISDQSVCKEVKTVYSENELGEMVGTDICVKKPEYKICGQYYYDLDIATHCENISAEIAKENAMEQISKNIKCGNDVVSLLVYRNASKSLSKGQIRQMVQTYRDIKDLLTTGSLNTAKVDIQAVNADGTIVTVDDKAALVSKIDECLGL